VGVDTGIKQKNKTWGNDALDIISAPEMRLAQLKSKLDNDNNGSKTVLCLERSWCQTCLNAPNTLKRLLPVSCLAVTLELSLLSEREIT
jgi:hypothetical protein